MEGLTLAAEEISNRAANIGAAAEEQMAAVEEIGASTSSLAAEAGKLRVIERFKY